MKLSWKDIITTLIVVGGGSVVYAKYYTYPWSLIGSWRSATALLALGGLVMFIFSSFNFGNKSILNVLEMILSVIAIIIAITGISITSHPLFYTLATILALFWLIDTARHIRHSLIREEGEESTSFHHHAHVH